MGLERRRRRTGATVTRRRRRRGAALVTRRRRRGLVARARRVRRYLRLVAIDFLVLLFLGFNALNSMSTGLTRRRATRRFVFVRFLVARDSFTNLPLLFRKARNRRRPLGFATRRTLVIVAIRFLLLYLIHQRVRTEHGNGIGPVATGECSRRLGHQYRVAVQQATQNR